jgi:hypothetical protein
MSSLLLYLFNSIFNVGANVANGKNVSLTKNAANKLIIAQNMIDIGFTIEKTIKNMVIIKKNIVLIATLILCLNEESKKTSRNGTYSISLTTSANTLFEWAV